MTPIDTTRLRALLAEASEPHDWSVATLAGCLRILDTDGGIVATVSEESDVRLIVAMREALPGLLDEVDRLRKIFDDAGQGEHNVLALIDYYQDLAMEADERAALAYPRALQAAANTAIDAIAGELDVDAERVADAILDLTEEQIDAFAREPEEGGTR